MKLFMKSLGVIVCTVLPAAVTNAAIEDTVIDKKTEASASDKSAASTKQSKDEKQNLANEPLPRGQLLYENQCHSCHESTVHIRKDHKAKNFAEIQYWVGRWANELGTKWSADEIDAVVQYLNDTFYHY